MYRQARLQLALSWWLLASVAVLVLPVCSNKCVGGSNESLPRGYRYYNLPRPFKAGMALKVEFREPVYETVGLILDSVNYPAPSADLAISVGDKAMFVESPGINGKTQICLLGWSDHTFISGFRVEEDVVLLIGNGKANTKHRCAVSEFQHFALPSDLPVEEARLYEYHLDQDGIHLENSFTTVWRRAVALVLLISTFFFLKCILTRFGTEGGQDQGNQEAISPNQTGTRDDAALYTTPMVSEVKGGVAILDESGDDAALYITPMIPEVRGGVSILDESGDRPA